MYFNTVKIASLILFGGIAVASGIPSASAADTVKSISSLSYQSYLAHIAAANHALRNHDTAEVQRWLAQAPIAHRAWEWHYLQQQASQAQSGLHLGDVVGKALQVSPDGLAVAIVASDKTVQMRDLASGKLRWQFSDAGLQPQALAFHPAKPWLAGAFSKHTVKLWNSADGQELRQFQGAGKGITAIAFSPDGKRVVTASADQTVKLWAPKSGTLVLSLPYETAVYAASFSPDGKTLYTLPMDGTVRVLRSSAN